MPARKRRSEKRVTIAGRRVRLKTRGDGNWYHIASFGRLVIRRDPEGWLVSALYEPLHPLTYPPPPRRLI